MSTGERESGAVSVPPEDGVGSLKQGIVDDKVCRAEGRDELLRFAYAVGR